MAWLKKFGVLIGIGLLGLIVLIVLAATAGKVKIPLPSLDKEFKVIDAEAEVKQVQAMAGRDAALDKVNREYDRELKALDESEQREHARLKDDPVKLAKLLARKRHG